MTRTVLPYNVDQHEDAGNRVCNADACKHHEGSTVHGEDEKELKYHAEHEEIHETGVMFGEEII